MQTGQFLYILMAFILIMSYVASINHFKMNTSVDVVANQVRNDAISLAQSIIEEAWTKKFDDLNNYNNLTKKYNFGADQLIVKTKVEYAKFDDTTKEFSRVGTSKTEHKIITITVTSPEYSDVFISTEHIYSKLN